MNDTVLMRIDRESHMLVKKIKQNCGLNMTLIIRECIKQATKGGFQMDGINVTYTHPANKHQASQWSVPKLSDNNGGQ